MRRRLSERQAWLWIADWIEKDPTRHCTGLCSTVADLRTGCDMHAVPSLIGPRTYEAMGKRLDAYSHRLRHDVLGFWWPRDFAGQKKRAAWARRQARQLERKS